MRTGAVKAGTNAAARTVKATVAEKRILVNELGEIVGTRIKVSEDEVVVSGSRAVDVVKEKESVK